MIEYKSNWNDKTIIMIDRFFPSSKMCNKCNYINQDLTLKDREWVCPSCNTLHNRDLNASLNILKQGLKIVDEIDISKKILSGSGIESDIKQKQGEPFSLEKAVNLETTTLNV
jgi:transposase